jgi:hypothetical protein
MGAEFLNEWLNVRVEGDALLKLAGMRKVEEPA